jgi:hypothetical protein
VAHDVKLVWSRVCGLSGVIEVPSQFQARRKP